MTWAIEEKSKAQTTHALILCNRPEAAPVSWEVNAANWAYYYSLDERGRQRMVEDRDKWWQSLDQICMLPRIAERTGIALMKRITQSHVNCVVNALAAP